MQKWHYEMLANSMRAVIDGMGPDNDATAQHYFLKLADELHKRNPNMQLQKFCDAAGL